MSWYQTLEAMAVILAIYARSWGVAFGGPT